MFVIRTLFSYRFFFFFFFNDTATTEIYTLSLHDALPIFSGGGFAPLPRTSARGLEFQNARRAVRRSAGAGNGACLLRRSEEHTSELQSRLHLVCRLLLEKKKKKNKKII